MESVLPMSLGLWLFGFAMTFLGGLSDAKGTVTELVTAIFAFAGGSILAFAGFRRSRIVRPEPSAAPAESWVDLRQTGYGLAAFSLGLILGAPAGIALRIFGPTPSAAPPATGAQVTAHGGPAGDHTPDARFAMQTAAEPICVTIGRNLVTPGRYTSDVQSDLTAVWPAACCSYAQFAEWSACKALQKP